MGSGFEAGPDPFAAGRVGGVAALGGQGGDDREAPAAVVVPVLLGDVQCVERQLDQRVYSWRVRAGVPYGDEDAGGVAAALVADLLAGRRLHGVGDQFRGD